MIICGDCLKVMKDMEENSIDSIVTDPPYGLKFMGKDWDHGVPSIRFWEAALRVAKPGAHLLAFGGTRTFHRLVVAIEDAGWVIRDTVGWIYGSGFPKSHNVGKAIDKAAGVEREDIGPYIAPDGKGRTKNTGILGGKFGARVVGETRPEERLTAPATPDSKKWDGYGTALKPAWEPIIVARKPLKGTVANNVLEHDTGAINIDGCRVEGEEVTINTFDDGMKPFGDGAGHPYTSRKAQGRWPANIIHDGSDEALDIFPQSKGQQGDLNNTGRDRPSSGIYGDMKEPRTFPARNDTGSAARFFYCAKASRKERGEDNKHPTVKPIALMRYLCRLVTPPSGIVFDPFMGSGSTGVAAIQEGFEFIGCDIEKEYVEIAKRRIEAAMAEGIQLRMNV